MLIDCHCDALYKLWSNGASFRNDPYLAVNYERWMQSNVKVQCFAIFVPPEVPQQEKFRVALEMAQLFYEEILKPHSNIRQIVTKKDILDLKENERGAMLTLEGLDCIGEDITKLKKLVSLGVRMVGLSWNYRNKVVDGILEPENRGLSRFGHSVVSYLNEQSIWIDLSHISLKGFDDVINQAIYPIASHSNVYPITPHTRNLRKYQIDQIIKKNGLIGVTYVTDFLTLKDYATLEDLIEHIRYLIEYGAENHIVLGSDFDGTDYLIREVPTIDKVSLVVNELERNFNKEIVDKICFENFLRTFPS